MWLYCLRSQLETYVNAEVTHLLKYECLVYYVIFHFVRG